MYFKCSNNTLSNYSFNVLLEGAIIRAFTRLKLLTKKGVDFWYIFDCNSQI
uniref:Uncharacterized protein n=1 Tax=Meloidogyne enterolobii TaxID=390850 RepID=A0A6V7VJM5_MELEN|nr:unnamed protein product [Meloidogyne enterolobii]